MTPIFDPIIPLWMCLPKFEACRLAVESDDKSLLIEIGSVSSRRSGQKETWALIRARWRFEWPEHDHNESWSWAWRRPSKRPGKSGRRFASTSQAYNAMMRETGDA